MRSVLAALCLPCAVVALVLLVTWGLSFPVGWAFRLDSFHALALSLGTVGIATLMIHAITFSRPVTYYHGDEDDEEESEDEDVEKEEEALPGWFRPCPCESGKPFNQCCGRKAYRLLQIKCFLRNFRNGILLR